MGIIVLEDTEITIQGNPTYTWASKPTAAEFGKGQAWFSDIGANGSMGYSDGTNWILKTAILFPSGDTTFATDSSELQAIIDVLSAYGGGCIELLPKNYWIKDIILKSGVSIVCPSLPAMNFNQVCPDLGFNAITPFLGGAVLNGTGVETIFTCNTSANTSDGTVNANDVAVSGVRLSGLVANNVASLVTAGGQDHNGLAFTILEHLYGNNISGTFLKLVNPQHINGRYLKAINCNHLLHIQANHAACQPGNSHFSDTYNYSLALPVGDTNAGKSTDWAYKLETIVPTSAGKGGGTLNYVTLNGRIQSNAFKDATLNRTRGNAHIVVQGANATYPVNSCEINGTDIEGNVTYGIYASYTQNLKIKVNGWAGNTQHVAAIKLKNNCMQTFIESNSIDTTLWIDTTSSCYLTGYIRYYATDNLEGTNRKSMYAKGLYTVIAECLSGSTEPPTYTNIDTNGTTFFQMISSNSYNMRLSETNKVFKRTLVAFQEPNNAVTADRTWNRWEASTVLLSTNNTTQTLPIIDADMDGVRFTFKSTDTSTHTIVGQSAQTIDGAANKALAALGFVTVQAESTGTKWLIVG